MQLRPILLNSIQRITELNQQFNIKIPFYLESNLLIKINGSARKVEQELQKVIKENYFLWSHFTPKEIFLVPNEKLFFENAFINKHGGVLQDISEYVKSKWQPVKPIWQINGRTLDFTKSPLIMGVLNVTPDSFSDGGRFLKLEQALGHALEMIEQGATIIDVGGESTRPGAEAISAEEELKRVMPVIEKIRAKSEVLISIDTYKSKVAAAALQAGADIINDISAGLLDPAMIEVAKHYDCPVILMHMKGQPQNMQVNPFYEDVVEEIYWFLKKRIQHFEKAGINKLIIDPGIGFGKRLADNLHLLRDLKDFTFLKRPILVGTSRKSFIGKILEKTVEDRLIGSLTTQILAVQNGANIVRVHDVQATADALKIMSAIQQAVSI